MGVEAQDRRSLTYDVKYGTICLICLRTDFALSPIPMFGFRSRGPPLSRLSTSPGGFVRRLDLQPNPITNIVPDSQILSRGTGKVF